MTLTTILLICVIVLAIIAVIEFHAIQELLKTCEGVRQTAKETNDNAIEVVKNAKSIIELSRQINDNNLCLLEQLSKKEQTIIDVFAIRDDKKSNMNKEK